MLTPATSRTRCVASATSGPMPSPGMSVIVWVMSREAKPNKSAIAIVASMSPDNPIARRVLANGLDHHVLEWAPSLTAPSTDGRSSAGLEANANAPVAMLLHGFMDAASTWDFVAPHLAAAGLRVIAPDLR